MLRFVVRRLLVAVPLLVAASMLSFALTTAMGDPLGEWKAQRPRTEQEIATQSARIGYDKPAVSRYLDWAGGVSECYGPATHMRDFDGNPERLTEMDALVAYLQIIGGLTDAAKKTNQTALGD